MTKLLQNKSLIKFLAIALSVLLIVALIPQISIAYGSKDDVVSEDNPIVETDAGEEAALADTGEEPEAEGEQPADEAGDPAEGEGEETPEPTTNEPAPQADEGVVAASDELTQPAKARAVQTTTLNNNENHTIAKGDEVTNSRVLQYTSGEHTLTVNGILHSDITVTNGAKLTIKGEGTIIGTGTGSVISVEGKGAQNSRLVFGEKVEGSVEGKGPKVTGGTGTVHGQEGKRVGGGIRVIRTDEGYDRPASLLLNGGTIEENSAHSGGGIYVDVACGFTMAGGVVTKNHAKEITEGDGQASEGGGIFITSMKNESFGSPAVIEAGKITENSTETTFSWGGGGIFVNSGGSLRITSAKITDNKADGLGAGVSGCPHASIAVNSISSGAAIYGNEAKGENYPTNSRLRLLDTDSVVRGNSGKRVAAGDFLFAGLPDKNTDSDGKTILVNNPAITDKGGVKYRWTGKTWSNPPQEGAETSTALLIQCENESNGKFENYGNNDPDIIDRSQDLYCARASYIDPTQLGSDGVAWIGVKASVPVKSAKSTIKTSDFVLEKFSIPVESTERYAALDASLGLTSMAESDVPGMERQVIISGNTSTTHGGGVATNGDLQFGNFPWNQTSVSSYAVSLQKEIVNSLGQTLGGFTDKERFTFHLKDAAGTYDAESDANGVVTFSLPGEKAQGEVTKIFELTEDSKDPYTPEKNSLKVKVVLNCERKTTEFKTGDHVFYTSSEYTTTVKSVTVLDGDGKEISKSSNGENAVVTNKLDLKTSIEIPVTKVADGIAAEDFTFSANEIDARKVAQDQKKLNLAADETLLGLATGKDAQTVTLKMKDSTENAQTETDVFSYAYAPESEPETHWYAIAEVPGKKADVSYDTAAYLAKVELTLADGGRSLETSKTLWKVDPATNELTPVTDDKAGAIFENVAMKYEDFGIGLTKQILTTLGAELDLGGRTFNFDLYDGNDKVATGSNEADGKVSLAVSNPKRNYAKEAYEGENGTKTFDFTLKETVPEGAADGFMATIPDATVTVTLKAAGVRTDNGGRKVFLVTPTVETVKVNGTDVTAEADKSITVTNRYTPNGTWQFVADKFFYGAKPTGCNFTMVELEAAPTADQPLAEVAVKEGKPWTAKVNATDFDQDGKASITFPAVPYKAEGTGEGKQNDVGDHFYLITEDGDDNAKDTTAYVVKVSVAVSETNPGELVTTETVLGYADDVNQPLQTLTDATERPAFYNTDTFGLISAANFSVYAASGEPVDQVCYVDPKIYKNLEGRAIKSGEFAFKLIEVANYDDTEGTVISATTNDEFGMVDFDKANNVSGDLENPSCLAYTKPGTYYYRVIEDTSKGGMNDQSVLYSDQVITFTTVIEQNEQTGQLECTDMYYGYWDKAAGKNVRFDEQYIDYDTTPANIGDMAKLNPDWHPTITNKTRPMDLQVRKTSVTDRNEGLVGATYALYMVNENAQGDIKLAEATSEEGGWITYKNVSLSTNNLYYFKETAAPAGHTVSEFRSAYFSLVEDAASDNGYTLQYRDTKAAAEASADAAPLADDVIEADMKNAAAEDTAADGDEQAQATDEETQPGYSADGNVLLTYNKDGGVADEATELSVSKLDTRTHEWVEGADLVILEKDSGKEIASWTSGKAPQKLEKTLNVGTTYLLREVNAPENYKLANDVEFVIDSYGNVSITKGTENGNAELSDNTINLYDTMMDAEEVDTQNREKVREVPEAGSLLAKTGDMLPLLGIGVVALAALIALLVAVRRRRANEKDSAQS